MSLRLSSVTAALVLLAMVFAGCDVSDDADPIDAPFQSVSDIVEDAQNFSTLTSALRAADLLSALDEGQGEFTLFAPNDGAFAAFDAATGGILDSLLAEDNADLLSEVLTYHVVPGTVTASDLSDGQTLTTLQGDALPVRIVDGTVYVGGAPVVNADTRATNGVVHSLGQVLTGTFDVVSLAALSPAFSSLVAELGEAELVDDLQGGSLTVFAPIDAAFAATSLGDLDEDRQTDVLLYHVVDGATDVFEVGGSATLTSLYGEPVTITVGEEGAATVNAGVNVAASYTVSNGVVHAIDQVLFGALNIVERASLTADLSDLAGALEDAELLDALAGDGPFTVFAPVNAAFEDVDVDDVADGGFLAKLLQYHVVPGELRAADLADGQTLTTLTGESLTVSVVDGTVSIDGTAVVTPNVPVENGVIHLIDAVLLEGLTVVERAIATPATNTLVTALVEAELVDALSGEGPFTVFAPDDVAFEGIQVEDAIASELLPTILTYHVVPGRLTASELTDGQTLTTLAGETLTVTVDGPIVRVNGVQVAGADNLATNGVIHVLGSVLLGNLNVVERAIVTPGLDTLVGAVVDAGLAETLADASGITVFAPTDEAFAELDELPTGDALRDVLLYHVLPAQDDGTAITSDEITDGATVGTLLAGESLSFALVDGGVFINPFEGEMGTEYQAQVVGANVTTSNGVVHVVNGVLLP